MKARLAKLLMLVIKKKVAKNNNEFQAGAIAQLGERLHGMQEVSGSIPLSSTKMPEYSIQK